MVTHTELRAAMSVARTFLSQDDAEADGSARYEALLLLSQGHMELGEPEQAYPYFQALLPLSRDRGDRDGQLRALCGVGHILLDARREPLRALPVWEEALALAREMEH